MIPFYFGAADGNNNIIRVIGVGGGGSNAVNNMYLEGIHDVDFAVCNTDVQDLDRSPVLNKVQIGRELTHGLGCGAKPEIGRQAALESEDMIRKMIGDTTKMVFVTAGMGGGTGTGAAPEVARIAREMGKLTVGIVTIPFKFEMSKKIAKAMGGIAEMSKHVDALLVINNERLLELYQDMTMDVAFKEADSILTYAAKSIAEIITVGGYMNVDFADACTVLRDSGVAIMNTGTAHGQNRIINAIQDALKSPLLKSNDISGAKRILINFYTSHQHMVRMDEIQKLEAFLHSINPNLDEFIWGATYDDELEEDVKATIIATGFGLDDVSSTPDAPETKTEEEKAREQTIQDLTNDYYGDTGGMCSNTPATAQQGEELPEEEIDLDEELIQF